MHMPVIPEPALPPNKTDELNFKLLAEISARFVNVSASEVDLQIEDALRRICEFHQIDHASVWQVPPEDPEVIVLTHLYRDPSLRPRPPRWSDGSHFPGRKPSSYAKRWCVFLMSKMFHRRRRKTRGLGATTRSNPR
jgi:hypothetical protein